MVTRGRFVAIVAVAAWQIATTSALAHHSFAAEYDIEKPLTVAGVVTKVEWTNPHARFYIDVRNDSGAITNWEFELGSPNNLMRRGWSRNSLKPGDSVSVEGFAARNDPHVANAKTVTLADGKKVFAGSSADTQTP